MNLGNTIKEVRRTKGFRQNELAAMCDITPSYLSQIENNLKDPNLSTLKIISTKLGVPLPILFFLSLDNDDVSPEKKNAFEMISPAVRALINEFFVAGE
jgi:XRE family transcriptional regulator, regulator of sulfur utilization